MPFVSSFSHNLPKSTASSLNLPPPPLSFSHLTKIITDKRVGGKRKEKTDSGNQNTDFMYHYQQLSSQKLRSL
jgi:hypothetical protein